MWNSSSLAIKTRPYVVFSIFPNKKEEKERKEEKREETMVEIWGFCV